MNLRKFQLGIYYLYYIKFITWKLNIKHTASINIYRNIWVSPEDIYRLDTQISKPFPYRPFIKGGEWEDAWFNVAQLLNTEHMSINDINYERNKTFFILAKSMKMKFKDEYHWKQTPLYEMVLDNTIRWRGVSNENQFMNRCEYLNELYEHISNNGYQTQADLENNNMFPNEICIVIGKQGRMYFFHNGKHRLLISLLLKIPEVPVNIIGRHANWQSLRDEITARGVIPQKYAWANNHPDLKSLI